jgi:anti-anti-sigma regulatory factor
MTLRIEGSLRQGLKVLTLIGRIQAQHIAELKELFEVEADHRRIVVDLREVRLADRETVQFLAECESSGIRLENCPAYIREWMERENGEGK